MFEISFAEMAVVAVIALIVIGPERLPRVARTVGHFIGRLQRYVATVKADIDREIQLEEFKKLGEQLQEVATDTERSLSQTIKAPETIERSNESSPPLQSTPSTAEALSPPIDSNQLDLFASARRSDLTSAAPKNDE